MLQSQLLADTVQFAATDHLLMLNSAADPFVSYAAQRLHTGTITLAEDNIATLTTQTPVAQLRHVTFHDYILHHPAHTMDVAVINLLYQPANIWMQYALQLALYALRVGGRLYVVGAKDRGILSFAKRMQEQFGNVETLTISKGQRVLCSYKRAEVAREHIQIPSITVFAQNKLDDGTQILLKSLQVHATDRVLDLGCGAGFIGLHIAHLATQGHVTMVDASLAAVAASKLALEQSGFMHVDVLPSDGAQAVLGQHFDLVVTNPPFHQGGIQTTEIALRFIRDAAHVLHPGGRFYIVANRFLKYEPALLVCFKKVVEVGGDTRYKVLLASDVVVKK